jgi:hypothetical protein
MNETGKEKTSIKIPLISTGEPSTLKTYRKIALILSGDEDSKAVTFLDEKIDESPHGEDEVVLADERQMIYVILSLLQKDTEELSDD